MTRGQWWRRNRWGVGALPIAVVAALAASSYRVHDYWWLDEPRDLVTVPEGAWVEFTAAQYDRTGTVPFTVEIRLDGLRPADAPFGDGELNVPAGARAVAVDLDLAASPDTPLVGCELTLRDAAGTEYAYQSTAPSITQAASPCVPPDARGPELDVIEGFEPDDGPRRPPTWSVSPVVIVPEDVVITEVVLSWGPPRGVRIEVSDPG